MVKLKTVPEFQEYPTNLKYICNCTVHTYWCIVCTVPFNGVWTFVYGTWATATLMYQLLQFRLVWCETFDKYVHEYHE